MKKAIMIGISAAILLGVICLILGGIAYQKQMEAIDIIGGADGPTATVVAGDIAGVLVPVFIIGILLIVGVLFLVKKKQNKA
ncbi:MAG: oxaloacetate decarboxylase [Clostridia bacterium]|nr:oxaloacetate decarboxylase [Clostridia bacterium]